MTDANHTPGPWRALPPSRDGNGYMWLHIVGADDRKVALATNDVGRAAADAHLIAAAPTLLAVAEELAACSEYWSEYDVPVGIHERLRAAIAAAKGEG